MRKPIGLSLEDTTDVIATDTDTTIMLSDTLLELNGVNDDHAQIQSDFEQLDEAESLTKTVEDITTVLEKTEEVPADAIAINNIAVEALITRLGLENSLPATTNTINAEYTVKENKETTKTAWEKIKAFIMSIIKKIGEFFKKIYNFIKDIVAKIKHTLKKYEYVTSNGYSSFTIRNEKAERVFAGDTNNILKYLSNIIIESEKASAHSDFFSITGSSSKKSINAKAGDFLNILSRSYKKEDPKKYHVSGEGTFYTTENELIFGKPIGFFVNDTGLHFVSLEENKEGEYNGMESVSPSGFNEIASALNKIEEKVKRNSKVTNAKLEDLVNRIKGSGFEEADKGVITLIAKSYSTLNMSMLKTAVTLSATSASYLQSLIHEISNTTGIKTTSDLDEASSSLKSVYDVNSKIATA